MLPVRRMLGQAIQASRWRCFADIVEPKKGKMIALPDGTQVPEADVDELVKMFRGCTPESVRYFLEKADEIITRDDEVSDFQLEDETNRLRAAMVDYVDQHANQAGVQIGKQLIELYDTLAKEEGKTFTQVVKENPVKEVLLSTSIDDKQLIAAVEADVQRTIESIQSNYINDSSSSN